jgi:4-amino-4-deoxy-L-arabinose transferase-like glycosyltransferase
LAELVTQAPPPVALPVRILRPVARVLNSPAAVFSLALIARWKVLSELLPEHAWTSFYRYNEPSHIAWALASGFGYSAPWPNTPIAPTAQQPPLFPLLLAGIFKMAGIYSYRSLWIALAMNAILSAFTAILILRVGRRDFSRSTGILAAWVWSCWLYEAAVAIRLWESTLAALLLMIALLMLPKLKESPKPQSWLLFGLVVAIAALTNTTLLSVLPLFWFYLWICYRQRKRSCVRILLASVAICALALLPWTIRNYLTFHRLFPVRDNFGLEFWVGVELGSGQPGAAITRLFPHDFPLSDPTEYNRMGEIAFMDSRGRMAMQFIRQNPREYLHDVAIRCFRFWSEPPASAWAFISTLAWIGAILAIVRKRLHALPYVVVIVGFPVVYYITHTFPTYRHPIEPVILLFAAYSVSTSAQLMGKLSSRWS